MLTESDNSPVDPPTQHADTPIGALEAAGPPTEKAAERRFSDQVSITCAVGSSERHQPGSARDGPD